jgi:hypothetical protein
MSIHSVPFDCLCHVLSFLTTIESINVSLASKRLSRVDVLQLLETVDFPRGVIDRMPKYFGLRRARRLIVQNPKSWASVALLFGRCPALEYLELETAMSDRRIVFSLITLISAPKLNRLQIRGHTCCGCSSFKSDMDMLACLPPLRNIVASVARLSQEPGIADSWGSFMAVHSKLDVLRLDGGCRPCGRGRYGILSTLMPIQMPPSSWLLPSIRVLVFCRLGVRSSDLIESLVSAGIRGLEVFVVTRDFHWRRCASKWPLSPTPAAMRTLVRTNKQLQCLVMEDQAPMCLGLQSLVLANCKKIALVGWSLWFVLHLCDSPPLDRPEASGHFRVWGTNTIWLERLAGLIYSNSLDDRLVPYVPRRLLRPVWSI